MPYASIDFDLWADVNGTIVELVQFAVSYELNKIPSCTCMLPVGYTALPPHIASSAHAVTTGLQLQIPLTVWVTSTLKGSSGVGLWPAGTYKIFCGWVTGVGYRRTHRGYSMTLEGTHWLSALSFASTLSATSHPHNPTDFIFNSAIAMGAGGALTHVYPVTAAQNVVTATNIGNDLWGQALKPWFDELACLDRINIEELSGTGNDGGANEAKAALDLININGESLPFDLGAANGDAAAAAIASDIAVETLTPANAGNTLGAMAHTTFWDKIVGRLAPKYFFSLVPYPTRAAIVPFIPGLRDVWNPNGEAATIMARDMSHQDLASHLPRPTRAVGLFTGHGSRAGGNLIPDDAVNSQTIGGMYEGRSDGIVILKRAPTYLANYVMPGLYSGASSGINNVRGNAFNHPNVGTKSNAQDPSVSKQDAQTILGNLAHAMYVNELLKQRFGDIVGAVRFDISPGSTISFQGTEASVLPSAGELRVGSVMRVSHFFDAQQQKCHTAFRLAHVRTAAEHLSANYTVTAHPLYTTTFTGSHNLDAGVSACPSMSGSC